IPVINDAGQVAFPCSFTAGSVNTTAIVRGSTTPGDRHIVVRRGDPAPDRNGNFANFDLATVDINGSGQVVFGATFTGTFDPAHDTSGILRGDVAPTAHLTLLACSGQTIDGVQLASLGNPPPLLNASGQVVFTSLLTGAILLNSGGSNTVVVRATQAAPDASGTIMSLFTEPPALNDLGQVAFAPLVSTSALAIAEFLRAAGSTIVQVVRNGDPAPDGNGTFDLFTTLTLLHPPSLNASGEIGFIAALAGATGNATRGIFRAADPAHVVQIVRRGAATPDANGSVSDFSLKGSDALPFNDAGQAAFLATLTGTAHGSTDNVGIFRGDGKNPLVRVVRKGQAAPNGDGTFSDFDQPAINAAGQVAFEATLTGTTKTSGIFLYDDAKGLIQVVRLGDPLLTSTIARVGFAPDTTFGRTHLGINASGRIAFQFDLADGREGVAVWTAGSTTTTTTTTSSTTTLEGASTTTTAVGATSSSTTSTSIGTGSSTTSTTVRVTPTTSPLAATTTTTLPPCTTARCTIGAATNGASCAGQTIPPNIAKKLALAITQAELAPSQTPKKAKRLEKSAKRLLVKAKKLVMKAARGRHPKLSGACAADLVTAIGEATGVVGAPK